MEDQHAGYKDGAYYHSRCPKCGIVQAAYIRSTKMFLCNECNEWGAHPVPKGGNN